MNILNSAPSFNKLRESFVWFLQTLHVQPSISCTYTFCLLFCETRFICFMLWICYYGYLNPSGGRQAYQKAIYSYRLSTWWLVRCTKAFIFLLAFLSINVTLSWNFCNQLMHYSKIIAPTCPSSCYLSLSVLNISSDPKEPPGQSGQAASGHKSPV